ncbi:MAG: ABC transporter ATP-binding protein [Bacteroidetes bacterium]|nr:ABC transporter ATP-binding protein [Bacteroidota bacterium]MDA0860752.1 ABC transporter ATP-binding protein [Bacteroidota bacterium]MDA1318865.1 ABC transporter ATP-binding protein [Bacteroidota bacterium]
MKELRYLNKYFIKYKYRVILGVIIVACAKIFSLFTPRLIGEVITLVANQISNPIDDASFKSAIGLKILFIVGAAIATGVFTFLMRQTLINVSRYIEFDLKNEIYAHYQRLCLPFYKQNRTGDLINRITEDVGKVRMYVGPALMYTINMVTLFIVALVYMYSKSPSLTLYTIIPLPILSVSIYFLSKFIHKRSTIVQEQLSTLTSSTQEIFSGITVTKAYALEDETEKNFTHLSNDQRKKHLNLTKTQAFFFPLMLLLIGTSNLLVIYIGGQQYINGEIAELGTIAEFIIYVNMLTWPVASVGWVTSLVQQAEASQKRINVFLKQKPSVFNTEKQPSIIKGKIEFKNVHFTYKDTNIEALKGISFTVEQGKTLAVIGKTGSGKTTILELIGRMYNTTKGDIKIDDISIKNVNLHSLRDSIGYVPQDPFLFSDTLNNNIKFGKNNTTNQEIIQAAKDAVVHDNIINFSKGYDTILGERGITLSGGQKQRVSIARAFIKSPQILLLDDCLSAVDTETEEQILNTIEKISKNTTTVIVSHRISSVKNADHIIVLEDGQIIQEGTHNQLVRKNGYYKTLYKKQLQEFSS